MSRPETAPSACERLRAFMADGAWHPADELARPRVGGARFAARLDEIRHGEDPENGEPLSYDWEVIGGVRCYRLRPFAAGEARPKPRRSVKGRIAHLERELVEARKTITELTARLEEQGRRRGHQPGQAELFAGVAHG